MALIEADAVEPRKFCVTLAIKIFYCILIYTYHAK